MCVRAIRCGAKLTVVNVSSIFFQEDQASQGLSAHLAGYKLSFSRDGPLTESINTLKDGLTTH